MQSEIRDVEDRNDCARARTLPSRYRERVGEDADAVSFLDGIAKSLQVRELMAKYSH